MSRLDMRGVPLGPIPARAGIGLRFVHHEALLEERPAVGWIEAHTENYFHDGAAPRALERARANYPLSLHGVGLDSDPPTASTPRTSRASSAP